MFGPQNMLNATCNIEDWLFNKLVILLPIIAAGIVSSSFVEIVARGDISVLLHSFEAFSKDMWIALCAVI